MCKFFFSGVGEWVLNAPWKFPQQSRHMDAQSKDNSGDSPEPVLQKGSIKKEGLKSCGFSFQFLLSKASYTCLSYSQENIFFTYCIPYNLNVSLWTYPRSSIFFLLRNLVVKSGNEIVIWILGKRKRFYHFCNMSEHNQGYDKNRGQVY